MSPDLVEMIATAVVRLVRNQTPAITGDTERLLATFVDVDARQRAREATQERRSEAMGVMVAGRGAATYMETTYRPRPGGWWPAEVA
jgi:hypothetical protein